jgi:hypothetical protein
MAVALAAMLAACGGTTSKEQEFGGANVRIQRASTGMAVASVELTISGYKGGAPQQLSEVGGVYSGSFEDIPAGVHEFCADAGADYDRSCNSVTINRNGIAIVHLVVQQKQGTAGTVDTDSPLITGVSLSDGAPYFGETITMTASAVSRTASHALAFRWGAACSDAAYPSDLADDAQRTATLTTSCHGTETITLTVTDVDRNISSVVKFPLVYSAQGANVSVVVNAWPTIASITTDDAQLSPGDRTTLTAVASDPEDGANVTYSWSADCGAATDIFNAPDRAATGFLAPNVSGDCKATVTVSDHDGGSTSGSIILHIGAPTITQPVFSTVPAVLPYSMPSLGFQATQTAELGDYISLTPGTGRHAVQATVIMVTWSPQAYSHPITLNVYAVSGSDLARLGTKTQTFAIPARPAADATCPDPYGYGPGSQYRAADGSCYYGFAFPITFDLTGITLPDSFSYGVAYDTNTWGYHPIGSPGPYESLNVGLLGDGATAASAAPFIGTDPNPDALLWNTATANWYADKGASGVGTFRMDTGWTGYTPAVEFFAY